MSLLRFGPGTSVAFTADAPAEPKVGIKKIKTIQVIQSDLFSGPNWRSLLDSTSFRLTWYEWRKTMEVTASTFEFGHLHNHPKKDRKELPGIFSFFSSPTRKRRYFLGEDGRKKNGGKCVIEFTTQKSRNRFLEKEKVTEECMKRNRDSQKNFWIFQREFQRRNDGNFMINMTQFPWSTCIVHKKIHGPLQFTSN